jgi:hypothetical protein
MTNGYDAEAPAPEPFGGAQDSEEGQGKAPKQDAQINYRMGNPMVNCGLCGYFQSKQHKCDVVDEAGEPAPGEISAYGFCNSYLKQDNPFLPGMQASFTEQEETPAEDAAEDEEEAAPRLQIGNRSY